MGAPLEKLHDIVDRWVNHLDDGLGKGAEVPKVPVCLDRLFPRRWQDVPSSNLSSGGSPIQLSVDTARFDELRLVLEFSWLLTDGIDAIAALTKCLPVDPARMVTRIGQLVGTPIPRLGAGIRLHRNHVSWKVYIGSDTPADFVPWIRSFQRQGLLSRDRDQQSIALCEHLARSAVMRGCSFAVGANDTLYLSGIYYRSLLPYRRIGVVELLHTASLTASTPMAISLADALGFVDGTGRGCFGYMIGLRPDGSVDNLKIEFGRIPWHEAHELSLESLRRVGVAALASTELLSQTIGEIYQGKHAVNPEVISWRGAADGSASIVTYFPLPRDDSFEASTSRTHPSKN